jgi:hypothetical protein
VFNRQAACWFCIACVIVPLAFLALAHCRQKYRTLEHQCVLSGVIACIAGWEILQQTHGCVHAFVSGAGTGGTIAGVSQALKAHDPHIQIVLADPQGSSLFNKVSFGARVQKLFVAVLRVTQCNQGSGLLLAVLPWCLVEALARDSRVSMASCCVAFPPNGWTWLGCIHDHRSQM